MRTERRTGEPRVATARRPEDQSQGTEIPQSLQVRGDRLALQAPRPDQTGKKTLLAGLAAAALLVAAKVAAAAEQAKARVTGAFKGLLLAKPIEAMAKRQEEAGSEARVDRRRRLETERRQQEQEASHVHAGRLAEALARLQQNRGS
ncbi:MAG: hypothetical protein VKO21_06900 [Candidatus Sericytochromatia bacterium]|nr:hypothetical protein [Candidatus Sericytochromatia bacterium]